MACADGLGRGFFTWHHAVWLWFVLLLVVCVLSSLNISHTQKKHTLVVVGVLHAPLIVYLFYIYLLLYSSRGKNPVSSATLSVRGSTVRAWILPESLNLDALLVDDTASKKKTAQSTAAAANGRGGGAGGGRGRGRGRGRR